MLCFLFLLGAAATPMVEVSDLEPRAAAADSSYFNSLVNGLAAGKCPAAVSPGNTEMIPCSRLTDDCNQGLSAFNKVLGIDGAACPNIASSFDQKALQTAFASYASPFCNPVRTVTSTTTFTSTTKETITTLRPASTTTISKCTTTNTVTTTATASTVTSTATTTVTTAGTGTTLISTVTASASPVTVTQTVTTGGSSCLPSPSRAPGCNKDIGRYHTENFNSYALGSNSSESGIEVNGYLIGLDRDPTKPAYNVVADGNGGSALSSYHGIFLRRISEWEVIDLRSFDIKCQSQTCAPRLGCRRCGETAETQVPYNMQSLLGTGFSTITLGVRGPWDYCKIMFADGGWNTWDNIVFQY